MAKKVILSVNMSPYLPGMQWAVYGTSARRLSRWIPVPVWFRYRSTVEGRTPQKWRSRVHWIFRGRRLR